MVHNLKLSGERFDAIRRERHAALPVCGKKVAAIAVGHIIEFLSLRDRQDKLRANQGHSIAVDVELKEALPPDVLWHGTGEKYLKNILAQGLLPQSRLYVHLSADPTTAKTVGSRHGRPVILWVDTIRMCRDGYVFYHSANGVWLTKVVPAAYLTMK